MVIALVTRRSCSACCRRCTRRKPDLASTLKDAGGRSGVSRGAEPRALGAGGRRDGAGAGAVDRRVAVDPDFVGLRSVNPGIRRAQRADAARRRSAAPYITNAKVEQSGHAGRAPRRGAAGRGIGRVGRRAARRRRRSTCRSRSPASRRRTAVSINGDEQWRSVSPHYFQTIQDPVAARPRLPRDGRRMNSARVVIINEAMAKKYWPKEDPIGR